MSWCNSSFDKKKYEKRRPSCGIRKQLKIKGGAYIDEV